MINACEPYGASAFFIYLFPCVCPDILYYVAFSFPELRTVVRTKLIWHDFVNVPNDDLKEQNALLFKTILEQLDRHDQDWRRERRT